MTISGETRLAAVIGWPVRHSRSPAIHNAAFRALDLDWCYLALPVAPGDAARAIAGMDALGIDGLSVTMPHKTAVAAALETCTPDAVALGAVNCVFREDGRLVGDNTDGGGFVDSLVHDEGLTIDGQRVVVVGAGGAARAVARALALAGAAEVAVLNRRPERAAHAAALAGRVGTVAGPTSLATADLVVHATPQGMGHDDGLPFDPSMCSADVVIADLVYHPAITPLLAAAQSNGQRTVGGIGMLIHQAARAFERWTGTNAPIAVMREAATNEIG